jgi:molybdopterin synthase sulfur carrier subunit
MTALVRIPTVLRPAMGGDTAVTVEGDTVGEILDHLTTSHPDVKSQLLNADGTLHRFLNVYVNDDDVRYIGGVDAPVSNGDEITLLPAVAGGTL